MNKDLLKSLFDEHKGKTVTVSISTLVALLVMGANAGFVPVPATQAYVDAKVTQATKGLPYLVKKEVEADVDLTWYDVICMREFQKQGVLNQMVTQYRDLVGEPYQPKTCEELQQRLHREESQG